MAVYGFDCSIVTGLPAVAGNALLQRILRGDDEIYAVKPTLANEIFHYGKMTYVQGIERSAVYRYVHGLFVQECSHNIFSLGKCCLKVVVYEDMIELSCRKLHL